MSTDPLAKLHASPPNREEALKGIINNATKIAHMLTNLCSAELLKGQSHPINTRTFDSLFEILELLLDYPTYRADSHQRKLLERITALWIWDIAFDTNRYEIIPEALQAKIKRSQQFSKNLAIHALLMQRPKQNEPTKHLQDLQWIERLHLRGVQQGFIEDPNPALQKNLGQFWTDLGVKLSRRVIEEERAKTTKMGICP